MSIKKLFSEIERTLKKCCEGILNYDDIHLRIEDATPHQRDRLESDLKKELKKLQKYRETIKQWINNDIIKDKSNLKSMRKQIEERMESFKKCEKETKTKAYSKEALRKSKSQPYKPVIQFTNEQIESKQWFELQIDTLVTENNEKEIEIENYQNTSRSNKKYRNKMNTKQQNEINKINDRMERNKWHLEQLQICLDKVVNNEIDPLLYKQMSDDVEYYVKEAMDDDTYIHYEEMYHVMTQSQLHEEDNDDDDEEEEEEHDDEEEDEEQEEEEADEDEHEDKKDNKEEQEQQQEKATAKATAKTKAKTKAKANAKVNTKQKNNEENEDENEENDDDDMMHITNTKANKKKQVTKNNKKIQLQKKLKRENKRNKHSSSYDSISVQLLQEPLKQTYNTKPQRPPPQQHSTQKQRPNKPPITNNTESDLAPFCRRLSDSEGEILDIINAGYAKRPQPLDTHEPSFYKPSAPYPTPPYFPKERRKMFDNSHLFGLMELDTLFFIFYYQSQSYQQFMAAKELKIRGWSFNKRYSAWFQRHFNNNSNSNSNVESVEVETEPNIFSGEDKLSPMKQNLSKNEIKSLKGKGQHMIVDNKYERGTYIFFDRNQSWQMRMRENFKFDYQYLEDEACVNVDDKLDWNKLATYGNGCGLIYGEQKQLMRYHQLQQRRNNSKQHQPQTQTQTQPQASRTTRHHHPTRPPTQRFRPPIHHRQSQTQPQYQARR